ncbi:MAG: cell division protein SepF [Promethearchaeota archaeon]
MGIFKKKEVNLQNSNSLQHTRFIKQITIHSSHDFKILRQNLLNGDIVVCDLTPLREIARGQNSANNELQNSLQQIRRYCLQNGGSVAKLEENFLLITPNTNIRILNQ